MSLLEGPPETGRSCQRLAESDRGKACGEGRDRLNPREPLTDMDEEPLGLQGGGSPNPRPGANGAGFSGNSPSGRRNSVKEWSCLGGAQGKRCLGPPPPGERDEAPLPGGGPVLRAGSPQPLQAGAKRRPSLTGKVSSRWGFRVLRGSN